MTVLILNKREIEQLLPMPECIGLMESALASLARGEVVLPLRPVLRVPDSPNVFAMMPAYSSSLRAIGAKLITVFPGNHGTGVDSHQGAVLLMDGAQGTLLALMDASSITAIRTAAVSGVATKLLARDNARTLAILGSGVQGRSHIAAMLSARPFEAVSVWSRSAEHARALASHASSQYGIRCEAASDPATAVRSADVVCTVTASREPVLRGEWLQPGTHVNAVGASIPTARELDTLAVKRSRLFVDRRESALNEAGDVLIPISEKAIGPDHIAAELGELLVGAAGRRSDDDITLFKSLGLAIEDLASAHFLYDRARREKSGTWVEF
ncbi:MAG TPA: ornithine cyclodeaminase family protein [Gemmatimonadaceae bacterium]|nr:ornithine cyclodeaminase family protein [Gemmatimonadaceae bacterium]